MTMYNNSQTSGFYKNKIRYEREVIQLPVYGKLIKTKY